MTKRVTVIERELKRGEASLNILPPLLLKEREIQGVRLTNNLFTIFIDL